MSPNRTPLPLTAGACAALALLLSSCLFSIEAHERDGDWRDETGRAAGGEQDHERAQKERALELARGKLEVARAAAADEVAAAEASWHRAEHELKEAETALEHYRASEAPQALAEQELELERARFARDGKAVELAQMEADYERFGAEHYARMTKEIVVTRARKELEFAETRLKLAEVERASAAEHEIPAKERELEQARVDAQVALDRARAALERTRRSGELDVLEAEGALLDAEHELAQLGVKGARPKP